MVGCCADAADILAPMGSREVWGNVTCFPTERLGGEVLCERVFCAGPVFALPLKRARQLPPNIEEVSTVAQMLGDGCGHF